ncbi:MAG: DEAD/DEAH box helicase, partial [Halobacteria archaeon]|nr:DEAD/DEAH box helicase [Halobacteria archaeon]
MLDLLISPDGKSYKVIPSKNGKRILVGELELSQTSKGPRPAKFRVERSENGTLDEGTRKPDEFVDLARMADRILVPKRADSSEKKELVELLSAYQLSLKQTEVCRFCLLDDEYTQLHNGNRISYNDEEICPDCAKEELRRELSYKGDVSRKVRDRLTTLLMKVGDVEKLVGLLNASLDPELTKFDEISENVEEYDEVALDSLPLDPEFRSLLPFDTLLPVSATATGKTLIGELAGIQNVLDGKGKTLFLVPLVALANQKYGRFEETYGDLVDVTERVGSNRVFGSGTRFDPSADVIVGTYEGIDHALRSRRDLGDIGTVVIDEVHNLYDDERGHRLDGLITRLKNYADDAQWIYLSATVGQPSELARQLDAS